MLLQDFCESVRVGNRSVETLKLPVFVTLIPNQQRISSSLLDDVFTVLRDDCKWKAWNKISVTPPSG